MTTKERKEMAKELYAAAERVEAGNHHWCCDAIDACEARHLFINLFRGDALSTPSHDNAFWFRTERESNLMPEVRARRVFGLLWCAELVKDGFFG